MSNRPHSREKRVSNKSGSVEKQSFGEKTASRVHSREERKSGNSASVEKHVIHNESSTRHIGGGNGGNGNGYSTTRGFGGNGGSGFGKLIRLALIVIIGYLIFSFVVGLFNKGRDEEVNNNNNSNNTSNVVANYPTTVEDNVYVANHLPNYNANTSSNTVNYSTNSGARAKFTKIYGNNQDEVTVMVYMIGSDLESDYGAATNDINEMLYSQLGDNINIVLETGGCRRWRNNVFSNGSIERWAIANQQIYRLDSKVKTASMTDPNTLTDFIRYSADNFPANRYFLILWDHGGGSVAGYGYDENYARYGSMSPDNIGLALKNSGIKFDVVAFDACLMANLETAIAIEPYADYMIASEETEPGDGWNYKNWLKYLDNDTSIATVDLGKVIVDDYISSSLDYDRRAEVTQSVIDLGELVYNIKEPLQSFSLATADKLTGNRYQEVANARGITKEFSRSSRLDQVDLVDLALKFNVNGSNDLINAIKSAVKYNKTANINDAYGLSAYFPYSSLSKMNDMVVIYDNIQMDESFTNVVKSFASYASSGQIVTQNSGNSATSIFDILMGNSYSGSSYSESDILDMLYGSYNNSSSYGNGYDSFSSIFGSGYDSWMDSSMFDSISGFLGRGHLVDSKQLEVVSKNGKRVVSLTNSQWELIDSVLLNTFVDDGEGYIDLGLDNLFEWSDEGDLIVESDGTWLSINDHFVSYYMVSDEYVNDSNYRTTGRIPAYLNGKRVDIMVSFTPDNPYGKIEGAKVIYADSSEQQKGLMPIEQGDEIKFICNYYTYDGKFVDEYQLGDTFIVNGDLELYNTAIENKYVYTYCFNDIYGNKMWTPKTEVK